MSIKTAKQAPEFTEKRPEDWINSPPLTLRQLRGRVVLIDFWTFGCWNCYRSFPWLNTLEVKFINRDFQVVGIHSPEFEHERIRDNIVKKIAEFELKHPVMIDNEFNYWRAMNNRYWPAFYLLDQQGRIRASFIGETHAGDQRALRIEQAIETLLIEQMQ